MNRDQLLASLQVATEDAAGVYFEDERYIDWSCTRDDGLGLELGDGSDAVSINMTWAEIERLQRALTLTLLNRKP